MKQTFDKKGSFFFSLLVVLASIGFWILYAIYDFLSLNQQISFLFFNEPLHFLDALFFNISYFSFLTRILVIAIFILAALTIRKTICSLREKNQELLEIQEKIQQNELLYRMLFDTNNDPIIMLKNWSIYKCNRKALSFFGYKSKEKLLSMLFLDLFPDTQEDGSSTKSVILDIQKRIITQNFDISPLSLYCKTSDNKLKPVILTISPFVLNNEWFCQVLLRDISMQRIYENELISSRTMAKTANQGKNRFISIINHELHPPLREMEASFNTLREKLHDPSLIPYIEEIHKAQGSIQSLSRYMEIFSTLETSPISFRKEPVQFHDITEEIRKKYTPLFQKQDVHFSIDCNAKDFCLVLDRQKFYQIVDCMLLNTLRHTDAHGNVSVQLNMIDILESNSSNDTISEETKGTLVMDIADSSIGFPGLKRTYSFPSLEDIPLDTPTSSRIYDLHFVIAAKLIQILEGSFFCENKPEKGCMFTIRIPHLPILLYPQAKDPKIPVIDTTTDALSESSTR